ncbi:patatin-like phospholipase family protein [Moritella viscosa]|uniref:Hydrolase n=1 Tax=Moritella viscosa TaxID=80854 RepID=A0ABY1HCA0_9GAMM|nr:patatin family protein [Moritella viscosa]SGY84735.1 Putative hydrolase [Moritella viscosa]SGY87075.1 Putative hydrolase [Moritella viscosa]SHO24668.1 Putative hydrolase [Moritella viscosa]
MNHIAKNTLTNIASCNASMPIKDAALVVEGGGQRGIFTAGVLDSWLAQDFNPFALLIGTSAGAQNLSSYMTRQSGHAKRSIMQLSKHPEFFNMKRTLMGRNTVNLDWYFDKVNDADHQLNMDCAQAQLKNRQLLFSATNISGFSPTLFEPTADNWLTMLKASSALPYLYKKGVAIGDEHYVDGGVSMPIPIQEAYHRGAKKIIVIRTVPAHHNTRSPWAHKLKSWVCSSQRCPKVLDIITGHENSYSEAIDFIHNPPDDAKIIEIAPPEALESRMLGSSDQALAADYQMGYEMGSQFLASHHVALFK